MSYPKLSVRQVERVFSGPKGEKTQALLPVDYQVNENDFITILGPSGCGKSTLLRIVAGLDQPTRGEVWLDGVLVDGPGADRGMVFQSYTLFPWLTVEQNICFGLQERGVSKAAQKERSDYFINKVGLRGFEQHFPRQLSGGMQQRTAIARALANDPKILLMDEPAVIMNKVKRAMTDSGSEIRHGEDKPGITNLLNIYCACTGKTMEEAEREFDGAGYGAFKTAVGEAVVAELEPVQKRVKELEKNKDYLDEVIKHGAERAGKLAARTLTKVQKKVGFPPAIR